MICIDKIHKVIETAIVTKEETHKEPGHKCEFCDMNLALQADEKLLRSMRHATDLIMLQVVLDPTREIHKDFMDFFLAGLQVGIRYGRNEELEKMMNL